MATIKKVITYGTFDLFHVGHARLLRRLRSLGDFLVVGLSTDSFNASKGKTTVIPYELRKEVLLSCRYVDQVLPETSWAQKREDIVREGASIFAMGEDWAGKFDDLADVCDVIYLPRTRDISTTEIKQWMDAVRSEKLHELKSAVRQLHDLVGSL